MEISSIKIGQTVTEIWQFFVLFKMVALRHILFVECILDRPARIFGGLYHCAKSA